MQWTNDGEKWRAWLVDYSVARAAAVEWLGDAYLLARPINRRPPARGGAPENYGPGQRVEPKNARKERK